MYGKLIKKIRTRCEESVTFRVVSKILFAIIGCSAPALGVVSGIILTTKTQNILSSQMNNKISFLISMAIFTIVFFVGMAIYGIGCDMYYDPCSDGDL